MQESSVPRCFASAAPARLVPVMYKAARETVRRWLDRSVKHTSECEHSGDEHDQASGKWLRLALTLQRLIDAHEDGL